MRPSKIEWLIAVVLSLFLFASWNFVDTKIIVGWEVDFADSIVHGDFAKFYQCAYDRARKPQVGEEHLNLSGRAAPTYDLPVYIPIGVWGLPLYLFGGIEYAGSFWKVIYGKGLFYLLFLLSSWLVYKICRALDVDKNRSQWAAFIYFTSSMAWNSICLVGNLDAICTTLTLAGVLAYIRQRHRECFLWFMLAFPFKQISVFIYMPLLLLRDKNLFRNALRFIAIAAFTAICNIPIFNSPEAAARKTQFFVNMSYRLVEQSVHLLCGEVSVFVVLYGLFLVYCWFRPAPSDENEHKTSAFFTALASMAITLSTIRTHAQWWLYLAPYLAVAVIYYGKYTEKILLFETVGSLGLLLHNYLFHAWVYNPKSAEGMLLDMLLGGKKSVIPQKLVDMWNSTATSPTTGRVIVEMMKQGAQASLGGVYILCIIVIVLWLCRPQNISTDRKINMHPYAMTRLLLNAAGCYLPLAFFVYTTL